MKLRTPSTHDHIHILNPLFKSELNQIKKFEIDMHSKSMIENNDIEYTKYLTILAKMG